MPWYSFLVQWPDGRSHDAGATVLPDHNRAHRYARLLIRELKQRPGYHEPDIKMIVKDEAGTTTHAVPF